MNSLNFTLDADDSALFRSSIIPKRKATETLKPKNLKQAKLSLVDSKQKKPCQCQRSFSFPNQIDKCYHEDQMNSTDSNEKWDKIWNESKSSYFQNEKVKSNNCSICQVLFQSDVTYAIHLKHCGKRHKMDTKQLLSVLHDQKSQMKKNKIYETSSSSKSNQHKENDPVKSIIQPDKSQGAGAPEFSDENCSDSDNEFNNQQKFLSNFVRRPSSNSIASNPRKKKNKKFKASVLSNRTHDERQRIITEKAAVVLLNEDNGENLEKRTGYNQKRFSLKNDHLNKVCDRVCRLWNMTENEMKFGWYVEDMKHVFLSEKDVVKIEVEKNCIVSPKEDDSFVDVSKLNLPNKIFDENWRKMINSKNLSDLVACSRDGQSVNLHSLILNVRCPLLEEKDLKSVFNQFDMSIILNFLEYVYCGTLNLLKKSNFKGLCDLAKVLNYNDLTSVLESLESHSSPRIPDNIEEIKSSSLTNEHQIIPSASTSNNAKNNENFLMAEDKDLFDPIEIDLTQRSREDSSGNEDSSIETNVDKSYWSFFQSENRKEKEEEVVEEAKDEDGEDTLIDSELQKVEESIKKNEEIMNQLMRVCEPEPPEVPTHAGSDGEKSKGSATGDFDKEFISRSKTVDECIVISSDTDSQESKAKREELEGKMATPGMSEYDAPYYDPYEDYNHFSDCNFSPVNVNSQSLLTGDLSEYDPIHLEQTVRVEDKMGKKSESNTPISTRQSLVVYSSGKKSFNEGRKGRCLSASRLLRKSLHLPAKSPKPGPSRRRSSVKSGSRKSQATKKKKREEELEEEEDWLNQLTTSLVQEFSNSPNLKFSTPLQKAGVEFADREFVEMTPQNRNQVEIEETVTPYPNYSRMEEAQIKEHLEKYGLKKNLGKRKAQKILKHIYEELHPYLNKETGKLMRKIIAATPKNSQKKKKSKGDSKKKAINKETKRQKNSRQAGGSKENQNGGAEENRNDSMEKRDDGEDGFDGVMAGDSKGSDFYDLTEVLTQSASTSPREVPDAVEEFLRLNPDYYEKILMYEPIWVRDLQNRLKETFKKHYKLEDLATYLDQQCITFRTDNSSFHKRKKKAEGWRRKTQR